MVGREVQRFKRLPRMRLQPTAHSYLSCRFRKDCGT